jgi:hypothetical protein
MSDHYPYVADNETQLLLRQNKPFRVKTCWNGVVIMNAIPLIQVPYYFSSKAVQHNVTFRASIIEDHCDSSECFLICKDYWYLGFKQIFINPNVKVAYHWRFYQVHNYLVPHFYWLFDINNKPQIGKDFHQIKKYYPEEWCLPHEVRDFDLHLEFWLRGKQGAINGEQYQRLATFWEEYVVLNEMGVFTPRQTEFDISFALELDITRDDMYKRFFFTKNL